MRIPIRSISSTAIICCHLFVCLPLHVTAQNSCAVANNIIQKANSVHLEPKEINDEFSLNLFAELLYQIDPQRQFLSKKDSIQLSGFALQLDDELNNGKCGFIPMFVSVFRDKVLTVHRFSDSLLRRPMDYSVLEQIEVLSPKPFHKNQADLQQYIGRSLKHEVLSKATRTIYNQNKNLTIENFQSVEPATREKIRLKKVAEFQKLISPNHFEFFIWTAFKKAICSTYDPHTEYFSPEEMEKFNAMLSPTGPSFGIDLETNHAGETFISRLVPGGPAWKTNELNEGDVLVGLTAKNKPGLDLSELDGYEIEGHLNEIETEEGDLTVRKTDGRLKTVALKKETIENTDNLILSFVIDDKRKFGYIALPGFYTNPEDITDKGCAGDVAKEVIKLKRDKIEGLILDLRFNGGGSMQEAIDLAGIFVESGPLSIIEEKGAPLITLRDVNRGSVYNGPLIIMVNGLSASASELVAAGLQDYNRAIIVGCTTYGKATGQIIVPIGDGKVSAAGFLKVTANRIYRVNGQSLQHVGIQPDIPFPDITESLALKESLLRNAVINKPVSKKVYYTPLPPMPVEMLSQASKDRIAKSSYIESVRTLGALLSSPVPLELKAFIQFMNQIVSVTKELGRHANSPNYKVYGSGLNQTLYQVDVYHRKISDNALIDIQKSFYIREAFQILSDWTEKLKVK